VSDGNFVVYLFLGCGFGEDVIKAVAVFAVIGHGGVVFDERLLSFFGFSHSAVDSNITESFIRLFRVMGVLLPLGLPGLAEF
jgi:hypothetical protein